MRRSLTTKSEERDCVNKSDSFSFSSRWLDGAWDTHDRFFLMMQQQQQQQQALK